MSVEKGLHNALYHITDSDYDYMYVIGTGKNELASQYPIIKKYWDATEDVLKKDYNKIRYKRITTHAISNTFKLHLQACLGSNKDENPLAKVIIMDDFAIANTFLIIGDKFLFISPTSLDIDDNAVGRDCFITEDSHIINEYTSHFLSIWERAKKNNTEITTVEKFENDIKTKKGI
ncbi:MAG TPA: hypothetical protein VK623_10790 [Flavobacterium sp.]|nr:hypothetical protein [Flavobacterium sp.]